MTVFNAGLHAHLQTGLTTTCRAWAVTRRDGVVLGFTDHDCMLEFDGVTFRADTGLAASALQQTTGLSVDNTEAIGALSDAAITEADIEAGRYDLAEVRAWMVNWCDVSARQLLFCGTIGEITRTGGAFEAELRGLADRLNLPLGRVFQKPCAAVLGDDACRFDMAQPGYRFETTIEVVQAGQQFDVRVPSTLAPGWFQHGVLRVSDGAGQGLTGLIKQDMLADGVRRLVLWQPIRAHLTAGDNVTLDAGCDKCASTCQTKFGNFLNFQGFPDIPGDDWSISDPTRAGVLNGGSRRS